MTRAVGHFRFVDEQADWVDASKATNAEEARGYLGDHYD